LEREIIYRQKKLGSKPEANTNQTKEPQKEIEKIQWLGTEAQLVYIIESLISEKLLPENMDKWRLIEKLFENSKKQSFKNRQLAQVSPNLLNNNEGKPGGSEKLDRIRANIKTKSE
jgi:hypothetical protein